VQHAPNETCLCAALRYEQAAYNYLRAGMRRKYAFHIVLAGHMYKNEHPSHALRCYGSALLIFKNTWSSIYDHVSYALAAQLSTQGSPGLASVLYGRLVGVGRQSLRFQDDLLR